MPKEGIISRWNMPDEVNNTNISIMLQEGSRIIYKTPNEVNNRSCSTALVTAKSTVADEIPEVEGPSKWCLLKIIIACLGN
ncbi:uncharacterized protein J3R85_004942 [Psidium guajava]|nr:uncharacterized protein J3R85_004942 [Psidium guajava]